MSVVAITRVVADLMPRLETWATARGMTITLDLDARAEVEEHLGGPLATLLLSGLRHARPEVPLTLRVRDRAGGDAEIVLEGLSLPADFPDSSPEADLWTLATQFLREFHRGRLGQSEDRLLLLLPSQKRAAALRSGGHP